jgi:glycine/D-amino acid oxidase-like deaminating enzyme
MRTALRSAEETDIDYEVFDAEQLAARFPQFKMYDGDLAILDVREGFIRPELTVATAAQLAQRRGAKIATNSGVKHTWRPTQQHVGNGSVPIRTWTTSSCSQDSPGTDLRCALPSEKSAPI